MKITKIKTVTEEVEIELPAYFRRIENDITKYYHIYKEGDKELEDFFAIHKDTTYGTFYFKCAFPELELGAEPCSVDEYMEALSILYRNLTYLVGEQMELKTVLKTETEN